MACKAAGKDTRTAIGQVPDAAWLPTMAEIAAAYNLEGTVVNNTNITFDTDEANRTMRFQLAYYAGPRVAAAQALHGYALQEALRTIDEEYRVLLNVVNSDMASFILGQRGYRVTLSSGNDGLLKTSLEPFSSERRGRRVFVRLWPNEDQTEVSRHARVLALMLADTDWTEYSEENVWTCWEASVVTDSAGKRWLAGSRAASNLVGELRAAVCKRAETKYCREPGVLGGCPRQLVGQLCAAGRRVFAIKELESRWGIDLTAPEIDLEVPHARPARKQCAEMVTTKVCDDDYIASVAAYASSPLPDADKPDHQDRRFLQPSNLRAAVVPQTGVVLSGLGSRLGTLSVRPLAYYRAAVHSRSWPCARVGRFCVRWKGQLGRVLIVLATSASRAVP